MELVISLARRGSKRRNRQGQGDSLLSLARAIDSPGFYNFLISLYNIPEGEESPCPLSARAKNGKEREKLRERSSIIGNFETPFIIQSGFSQVANSPGNGKISIPEIKKPLVSII